MPQRQTPDGTVTLRFTDVLGSSKRWEHNGEAMPDAWPCHPLTKVGHRMLGFSKWRIPRLSGRRRSLSVTHYC